MLFVDYGLVKDELRTTVVFYANREATSNIKPQPAARAVLSSAPWALGRTGNIWLGFESQGRAGSYGCCKVAIVLFCLRFLFAGLLARGCCGICNLKIHQLPRREYIRVSSRANRYAFVALQSTIRSAKAINRSGTEPIAGS